MKIIMKKTKLRAHVPGKDVMYGYKIKTVLAKYAEIFKKAVSGNK